MGVLEIKTEKELKAWFEEYPPAVAQVVAARAALRLLPYVIEDKDEKNFASNTVLPVFQAVTRSWVASKYGVHPTETVEAPVTFFGDPVFIAALHAFAAFTSTTSISYQAASACAVVFSRAPHAAPRVAAFWKECLQDCSFLKDAIEQGGEAENVVRDLAGQPLWRTQSMPAETLVRWNELKNLLSSVGDNWPLWRDWYQARLEGGKMLDVSSDLLETLDVGIATLDEKLWKQGPAVVNAEIKRLMDEIPDDRSIKENILVLLKDNGDPMSIDDVVLGLKQFGYDGPRHSVRGRLNELTYAGLIERVSEGVYALPKKQTVTSPELPAIPDQTDGIKFTISEDHKIAVDLSGTLSEDPETEMLLNLREQMLEMADDILSNVKGSNTYAVLDRIVSRYKAALEVEVTDKSITQLVSQGLLLTNEYEGIKLDVEKGELPDLPREIATPLQGLISSHGMAVLSTKIGRNLLAKERDYKFTQQDDAAYQEVAAPVLESLANNGELIERETGQLLVDLTAQHGSGRHPERAGLLSRLTIRNVLVTLAAVSMSGVGLAVGAGFLESQPGLLVKIVTKDMSNLIWQFLQTQIPQLLALAQLSGGELSWLRAFFDWMQEQKR